MRHTLLALGLLAILASALCAEEAKDADRAKQGVEGAVERHAGGSGVPPIPDMPVRMQVTPIPSRVLVFKGHLDLKQEPSEKDAQWVKTVETDKQGKFKLELEPGEYTLAALVEKKLFAMERVTVKAGEFARRDLIQVLHAP